MAKKKGKKKGKKKDLKKKNLKKKDISKKNSKKKKIKKESSKKKEPKNKVLKKKDKLPKPEKLSKEKPINTVSSFNDHSSNYNVRNAIIKLKSLQNSEQIRVFTKGEKRLTIIRAIPISLRHLEK